MALADRVIIGFNDMVRRGMQGRHHVGQFVEHRQIIQHRVAAHVIKIAQEWRAGHRHKDGMFTAQPDVISGVARVIGEIRRDRGNQVAHQTPVKIDQFALYFGTSTFPVGQRDLVPELNSDVFQDVHRGRVDARDLTAIHHFADRDITRETRKHVEIYR